MKKSLLTVALLLAVSSVGWAGACPSTATSLSTIETTNGGSCSVGALLFTFTGSSYSSSATGGALAPTTAQVNVQTYSVGEEFGLEFTSGWVAGPNQTQSANITFTVTCPGCTITDAVLIMGGASFGTGSASVSEVNALPSFNLRTSTMAGTGLFASSMTPTTTISSAGGPAGIGHISGVFDLYSVPESASLALLGTALIGVALVLRRRLT